ncbi:MAG: TonB-dependent receptor [Bacteroidetes bacterium]|nr:TonB-dependent receptor [Bacteroidota bacterium]
MNILPVRLSFLVSFLLWITSSYSQGTLSGKITDKENGESLIGATVYIPDLKTGASSDKDGNYTIRNLPSGSLLFQVSYIGYKSITVTIDLRKTTTRNFELTESVIESQEVVITGNALSSENSRSSVSITPINKLQLFTTPSTNIINAIATVPGVSEITTGGEISKPVIRGLSYNHVVTLNEGVRQEGSQWGDEHGIEIDQFSVDRIEVLKGPASLFYGSDAMGGVINILEPVPAENGKVKGEVASQFSTSNRLFSNSLMVEGNQGGFLWRLRGTYKNAAAYKTPPEYVYNSAFTENNYNLLLGLVRKWGFTHLHVSAFNTKIGMIDGTRDSVTRQFLDYQGNPVSDEQARSRKIEVPYQIVNHYQASSSTNLFLKNSQVRFNIGYQVNKRREFAVTPDMPGLYLQLATLAYDARYTLQLHESFEFVAGISGMTQSNLNKGVEFLVPDYDLQDWGGFVYGKKSWEKFTLNAGIRFDYRSITGKSMIHDSLGNPATSGDTVFPGFHTGFSAVTGSAGFTFRLNKTFNLKFNVGRGFRAPNIAELGANGVHEGTFRYEIGNPLLKPETSLQVDGEISANIKWLSAVFNGFYNVIDNYIYARNFNGEMKTSGGKAYQVFRYIQGNSVLKGFEFELDIHPVDALHFDNNIDYVWGKNLSSGIWLPYIPALHTMHDIRWTYKTPRASWLNAPYLEAGLEIHFGQYNTDTFETCTPGYVLINASVGANLKVQNQVWTVYISGKNLADEKYFDHLSRLKYVGIYNMGRNITFGLILPFGIYDHNKKD